MINEAHPDFLVYAPIRFGYSACSYYRAEVPLRGLGDLKLATVFLDRGKHENDGKVHEETLTSLLAADIDLFYAQSDGAAGSLVGTIQGMKTARDAEGNLQVPPSCVYDIDDNLDWVHPYNTSFAIYGTRDRTGRLLMPGEPVMTRLADGSEVPLWEDMKTSGEKGIVFNIERNSNLVRSTHINASRFDGFTTTTKYLGDYLHNHYGYPEPYIFPNSIILDDYFFPKLAPHEGIRILWQGGASHMSDWWPLRGAVKYIAEKHPEVTFVVWGTKYPWLLQAIPEKQVEYHPWLPYDAYKVKRHALGCDINLCVLSDDDFGRSKSCIKWYEGSLGPNPEATLAADCLPYNEEIVDGETGLLYKPCPSLPSAAQLNETAEQFVGNLELLINDADLRRRLAENARAWVMANRDYKVTVPGLYEYYKMLREKKARETEISERPPKPSPVIETPFVSGKRKRSRAKRKAAKAKGK